MLCNTKHYHYSIHNLKYIYLQNLKTYISTHTHTHTQAHTWKGIVWKMKWSESHSVESDCLRLYSTWNSPGQNTGGGSLSLLQGMSPIQGSSPGQVDDKMSSSKTLSPSQFFLYSDIINIWHITSKKSSYFGERNSDLLPTVDPISRL